MGSGGRCDALCAGKELDKLGKFSVFRSGALALSSGVA
jgi:hypothetical protein